MSYPRVMRALLRLGLAATFALAGCSADAPGETPEGVTRELVERLLRLRGAPEDSARAFELLSTKARDNLGERARRYTDACGKQIAASAMMAPSRFLLRFEPQSYEARVVGAHALVEVKGPLPSQRAEVPCVFEDGTWRVDLQLPLLPAVQSRPRVDR
jgi:hypothetical protein